MSDLDRLDRLTSAIHDLEHAAAYFGAERGQAAVCITFGDHVQPYVKRMKKARAINTSETEARRCCSECVTCHSAGESPCWNCRERGREAFWVLVAIGMAAACAEYAAAMPAVYGAWTTDEGVRRGNRRLNESLAILCGVDVETVARWR